jgi:hypothetical protein
LRAKRALGLPLVALSCSGGTSPPGDGGTPLPAVATGDETVLSSGDHLGDPVGLAMDASDHLYASELWGKILRVNRVTGQRPWSRASRRRA